MNYKLLAAALTVLLVFTACINVEVKQKINRDQTYDLYFTISTTEGNSFLLEQMKESLAVSEEAKDNYEFISDSNSITHKFTGLEFGETPQLFQEVETDNEGVDSGLVDPELFMFRTRFDFPYYYHTFTFGKYEEQQTNTSEIENAFSELIQTKLVIEVYGTIIEADGVVNGNKVTYDLMTDTGEHEIVFKDFFLLNWYLGKNALWYWLGTAIFLILLVLPYFLRNNKKIIVDPKLKEYINSARKQGAPDEKIKSVLVQGGWAEKEVNKALKQK